MSSSETNPFLEEDEPIDDEVRQPLMPTQPSRQSTGPSYLKNKSRPVSGLPTPVPPPKPATTYTPVPPPKPATTSSAPPPIPPKPAKTSSAPPPIPPKPAAAAPPPVPKKDSAATADMLDRRARELDERERELNAREAHARQLEANIQEGGVNPRAPNWPPCLPKKWVYQDFEVDIPEAVRSRVKLTYYHMFAILILLLYNMLCGVFALILDAMLGDMIISCFLVIFVSCIVFFTYRRLYNASRVGSSLSYGIFLVGMIVEIIIDILGAIGWGSSGFLGIKNGIDLIKDECKLTGIMCIAGGVAWILSFLFDVFLFITVRNSFNAAGGLKAFRKQAVSETGKAVVGFVREHPEEAKKAGQAVGKAAVDYARENPDVVREVAVSAARESQPLLH